MEKFILISHSQGGLVAQSVSNNSPGKIIAVVLLGTFPLGMTPPVALMQQEHNMDSFPVIFISL
jgi:pimeloyl-ACP methyl ester carboxylesterase